MINREDCCIAPEERRVKSSHSDAISPLSLSKVQTRRKLVLKRAKGTEMDPASGVFGTLY